MRAGTPPVDFLTFYISLLHSLLVFPGATCKINYLHSVLSHVCSITTSSGHCRAPAPRGPAEYLYLSPFHTLQPGVYPRCLIKTASSECVEWPSVLFGLCTAFITLPPTSQNPLLPWLQDLTVPPLFLRPSCHSTSRPFSVPRNSNCPCNAEVPKGSTTLGLLLLLGVALSPRMTLPPVRRHS